MVAPGAALDDVMGAIDVAVGAVRTDVPISVATPHAAPEASPCAKIDAQFGGRWESDPNDTGAHEGLDDDASQADSEAEGAE